MPNRKIITTLIICLAFITSVWMVSSKNSSKSVVSKNVNVSAEPAIKTSESTNDEWKKILTSVDTVNKTYIDLTKKSQATEIVDDGTLTEQLSRDFMSQYFLAVKDGSFNTSEAAQIAVNSLSLPEYQIDRKNIYRMENLRLVSNSRENMVYYRDTLNEILKVVYYGISNDPIRVVVVALQDENENELKKLDPIITVSKSVVKHLLTLPVPQNVATLHLELLNISAKIQLDLEKMRTSLNDPVAAMPAISEYSNHLNAFGTALININNYFSKNSL